MKIQLSTINRLTVEVSVTVDDGTVVKVVETPLEVAPEDALLTAAQ